MKPIPYLLGRIKRGFVPALVFLGQVPYLLILLTLDQIGFSQEVFVCLFVYLLYNVLYFHVPGVARMDESRGEATDFIIREA